MQNTPNIILGIDPGTVVMGYGVISIENNKAKFLGMGAIKLRGLGDTYDRLEHIHINVKEVIELYKPTHFAIEAPFFGKNVQSMLKLGRAQGVAIAAAMQAGLPVCEYSPKKVKQSITGNGNAAKEQVMRMLQHLLKISDSQNGFDATDALAVALCHHYQSGGVLANLPGKAKSWEAYIKLNPGKVSQK